MKYLIVQCPITGFEAPVFFTAPINHNEIEKALSREDFTVVSAGYCEINGIKAETFGESVSLPDIPRREEDAALIHQLLKATHSHGR